SASDLTLAEAAVLAAVAQAPDLNPINAPELAIERQGKVLEAMLSQGYISVDQAANANNLPLELRSLAPQPNNPYEDFIDLVISQLRPHFGLARLQRGGLKIITTLDIELQSQTACATSIQIARINNPASPVEDCQAGRLLPTLKQEEVAISAGIDANVVIIDPNTGQILTLIGDAKAQHAPGTVLSPFVYLTAFTRGFSPASLVWDIPASLPADLAGYSNSDGEFHGPIQMRSALANDYIIPTLQTLNQIGMENVWITAEQSGINGIGPVAGESSSHLLLDEGTLPLLDITHAYSMLANQGFLSGQPSSSIQLNGSAAIQPTAVLQVVDYSNRSFLDWVQPQLRAVSSAQLAYLVTNVLSDVEARRPSLGRPNLLEVGRPAASKIGQTTNQFDTWTVGYTPQLAIGVWVGYPDSAELTPISPSLSAGLWNAVLKYAHLELASVDWDIPAGIVEIDVCSPSGLLPTVDCPTVVEEVFIPGNEPVQLDNLYRIVEINRLTGRLATVFTPPENIDEQIFLSLPPEALAWARQTNFPIPPETYDVLFISANQNPNVSLSTPAMFSYINGRVEIVGSALGEGFDFYRVQVGEGLNPSQWLQVGTDGIAPVSNAPLAVWNTGDVNGLFAVQLVVVYQDQTVETSTIQVTVDNQAPDVNILFPTEEQTFEYPEERNITFQVQASDNLGIDHVEFFVDGELVSTLTQAPFAVPWLAPVGEHTLLVIVYDLAGNITETEITFKLQR
ncbi:MAG: Ig-like domain-containing protein, partial [Chloroflexota bacterium]